MADRTRLILEDLEAEDPEDKAFFSYPSIKCSVPVAPHRWQMNAHHNMALVD
jgi:hypothetical protein